MDGGVGEPVKINPAVPQAIATDQGPKKAGAGRLPLKTLDAFTVTASKGCTPKRRLSESSDKPAKAARCKNSSAGGGSGTLKANRGQKPHVQRDSEEVCSEVTSSCDSDKLSPPVPSKVVGPLDGYTCVLPQPDPVGVSSTIEEGLKQAQRDIVLVASEEEEDDDDDDDEDGDPAKQLNESCSSNSTAGEIRSSQQSSPMDGTSAAGSGAADVGAGKKSVKKRSGAASELRDQKRLLLEEKKKQKAAEKLERQKRIQEDKERREQEKQAKEAERKLKQEEKERERLDKERDRLEKLQEKEEKRKRKSEVEQKQLEEKRRKEDEKQKAEEEKQRQQQAQKNLMLSFFKKAEKPEQPHVKREPAAVEPAAGASCVRFKPFQVKEGMRLAPILRQHVTEEQLQNLDAAIKAQGGACLYTTELRGVSFVARKSGATVPHVYQDEEVHVVEVDQTGTHMCKKKRYMKAKLLQFTENYRPAYYGTWRKTSAVVRPRRPFACDSRLLNYEVDSDEEWDEEEPGESTSVKDDDEEDDEGNDEGEEMDPELQSEGFLVEHGYLSDGEGANADEEEEEGSLEQRKEKQRLLNRLDWEQKKRRQRTRDQLRATVIGCFYDDGSKEAVLRKAGEFDALRQYQAVLYASAPIATALCNPDLLPADDDGREASESGATPGFDGSAAERSASALARRSGGSSGQRRGRECQAIPEEAMPDLVWLVHGNILGLQRIIKEFVCYWKHRDSSEPAVAAAPSSSALSPCDKNSDKDSSATEPSSATAVPDATGSGCSSCAASASPPAQQPVSTTDSGGLPTDTSPSGIGSVPAAEESGRTISKRQLAIKIRAMAVYEKRAVYKRSCWYVHEEAISRYFGGDGQRSKSELVVPTTWKYATKQQQTPSRGRPPKASKANDTATSEHETPGSGISCVTPKSALHLAEPDDSEVTMKPGTGPTPRKPSPVTPGGLTPITNFTVAKACQPRRIVPTVVSAVTGTAPATRHPDDGSKLTNEVVSNSLLQGDTESSSFVPPNSIPTGLSQGSRDLPKSRRITLTTLYAAPTNASSILFAKTSGTPKHTSNPEASHIVSSTVVPAADQASAVVPPQSTNLKTTEVKASQARPLHAVTGSTEAATSPHPSLALGDACAGEQELLGVSHHTTDCLLHAAQPRDEPDLVNDVPSDFAQTVPGSVTVGAGSCPGAGSSSNGNDCRSDARASVSMSDAHLYRDGVAVTDLTQPAQVQCMAALAAAGKCSNQNGSNDITLCLPQEQCSGSRRLPEPVSSNGAASCLVKPVNDAIVVSDDDSIL